eukprot:TRINITY_DN1246_c0_g1_i1.p1 TRINITY_DN1246_c0_g1~~TRINITY_DN1246_c0_g1_i1.p1  ORF type:complete len:423 (+),score=116.99 TRINITY_DN1246_c0_g1_i1:290-1558(+)
MASALLSKSSGCTLGLSLNHVAQKQAICLPSALLGCPLLSRSSFSGSRLAAQSFQESRTTCSTKAVLAPGTDTEFLAFAESIAAKIRNDPTPVDFGLSYDDFNQALDENEFTFEVGDIVRGKVYATDRDGVYVDIGAKSTAICPISECSIYKIDHPEEAGIEPDSEQDFMILRNDNPNGEMVLSIRRIQYELAWEKCRKLAAEDKTVTGTVVQENRGGILVLVEGLRGFVPLSHVATNIPREQLLGVELPLKFLEVDEENLRLVMSNRKAAAKSQMSSFGVGDVVIGTVQAVKPYGAFIDVGGINGLLHISQISHDRITNVETVLSEGDKIKVMILSQDSDRGRISLSTKKLEPTPGDMLRNPQLVFDKADEMAKTFKERVAAAEAAARAEENRLRAEGFSTGPFSGVEELGDFLEDEPATS